MREEEQSEMKLSRPLFLTVIMFIVILVTPSYIYFSRRIDISAIIWILRIEQDEPIGFFLTLDPIYFLNGFMKYVFLIIVFGYFTNRISMKKTVFLGLLIETLIFLRYNFGNLLYIIFPVPGMSVSCTGYNALFNS